MSTNLPSFDETSHDIMPGYGVEQSHDGFWYAYRVPVHGETAQVYLKDDQGLDRVCASRDEAVEVIERDYADNYYDALYQGYKDRHPEDYA